MKHVRFGSLTCLNKRGKGNTQANGFKNHFNTRSCGSRHDLLHEKRSIRCHLSTSEVTKAVGFSLSLPHCFLSGTILVKQQCSFMEHMCNKAIR
jgi:hypothetical protein